MGTSNQLRGLSAGLFTAPVTGRTTTGRTTTGLAAGLCLAGVLFVAGCGKSGSSAPSTDPASTSSASSDTKPAALSTASIATPTSDAAAPATAAADGQSPPPQSAEPAAAAPVPVKGSPEWLVGQIIVLRGEPIPKGQTPQEDEARHREQNEKLIEMAHEVIKNTHRDKSKQQVFDLAVHFLVECQVQMAIAGNKGQSKQLIEDAKALYKRDPASASAAEAAFGVVRVAHNNARRFGKTDPRYLQDFAVQARLFATQFPKQDMRAVQLLSAAAQT